LILRGSDRAWTTREVAAAIRVSEAATRTHLQTLTARGLLDAKPGTEVLYRYRPRTAALRAYVDLLVEHYVRSWSDVVMFVARRARQGIKSFSDAFKLKTQVYVFAVRRLAFGCIVYGIYRKIATNPGLRSRIERARFRRNRCD